VTPPKTSSERSEGGGPPRAVPAPSEWLAIGDPAAPALGRDPFSERVDFDPFVERLDALHPASSRLRRALRPPAPRSPAPRRASGEPLPQLRRSQVPALEEVEIPTRRDWIDRLLGDDERRRLAAVAHLAEGEVPYDRFGFSPDTARAAFPWFQALYRFYFRVRSAGHENIPPEGPALLVGNHGGLLPFDAAMGVVDVVLNTNPPRLPRAIVDRWAGSLPWVNVFYARCGQVIGTRENFSDLLEDGQIVLVFPEGMEGVRKPVTQRYRLQSFRVGFIEHALRARAPIVPVAFVGSDDQAPILYDFKSLAKRLGLPALPITPTFPWLGPLGLLPYPVGYRIVYGEPLPYHERFGPEGADDARLVRYLANQVRRSVQQLVDRNRS
jgi:1-acyl-sn-glycerol-3-phosphate acyltransferase